MDELISILALLVGAVLFVLLVVRVILWALEFRRELAYVKMEINRTEGEAQKYWKRRKRKLWLSIIPFYR